MKRWALVVIGLYLLILGVLTVPVIEMAFFPRVELLEAAKVYGSASTDSPLATYVKRIWRRFGFMRELSSSRRLPAGSCRWRPQTW